MEGSHVTNLSCKKGKVSHQHPCTNVEGTSRKVNTNQRNKARNASGVFYNYFYKL